MSEHNQRLKVLFDWIVRSDLEGSTYFLENILKNNSVSSTDQIAQIGFLNANEHMAVILLILESDCSEVFRKYLIKSVRFKIDNLESLAIDDSRYFYPLLDENKRIEPNWGNFQHYYDSLRDAPNHLLNEGYQELVDHYPAELSSTIADNLEDVFIWNNDLILEAYTAFIEKIDPEPFNLTENLDWDKIHFLDKNSYLEYSEESITTLFQQIDEEEANWELLIKILENFDQDNLSELLHEWLISESSSTRIKFISLLFQKSTDIHFQTIVFDHCLHKITWGESSTFGKEIPITEEMLLNICKNLSDDSLRVKLIIEFFTTIILNDLKNIRTFFAVFEDEQFKKLSRNTKTKPAEPVIENNEINRKLVELLLENDIVKKETENTEEIFLVNKPF